MKHKHNTPFWYLALEGTMRKLGERYHVSPTNMKLALYELVQSIEEHENELAEKQCIHSI